MMALKILGSLTLAAVAGLAWTAAQDEGSGEKEMEKETLKTATFGGGCFWCVEAVFERIEGVESAVSGYAGGTVENPTYQQVCGGRTGHAEVVQIRFDPEKVSYEELLKIFFKTHDPTTQNRQGSDVGTQYRSIILTHDDEQKERAEKVIRELTDSKEHRRRIVTEVVPFDTFYAAEDYHQDYYGRNPSYPYCSVVIDPKIRKLEKTFKDKLKEAKRAK